MGSDPLLGNHVNGNLLLWKLRYFRKKVFPRTVGITATQEPPLIESFHTTWPETSRKRERRRTWWTGEEINKMSPFYFICVLLLLLHSCNGINAVASTVVLLNECPNVSSCCGLTFYPLFLVWECCCLLVPLLSQSVHHHVSRKESEIVLMLWGNEKRVKYLRVATV